MSEREHRGALLAALFVTFLWSTSWVLIRWGLDDESLSPIVFAGLRYLLAAGLLAALVAGAPRLRSEVTSLGRRRWAQLAVLGVVFVAVAQGAQFVAIDSQPAATSSLILALTPLLVTTVSSAALGEKPTGRQVAGALLILTGAAVYFAGELGFTAIGLAASVVGLVANAAAVLIGRGVNRRRDLSPVVVTVASMMVGAVALMVVGIVVEGVPSISARAWLIIGWLAAVNTAWAFTIWNRSLQRLSASESAAVNNTMLIQIGLLAWLFLDEAPGLLDLLGMGGVSVGVYLAQRPRSEAKTPG